MLKRSITCGRASASRSKQVDDRGHDKRATASTSIVVALPAAIRLNFCVPCAAPNETRRAEHQQQVADDAPCDRGLDDFDVARPGARRAR